MEVQSHSDSQSFVYVLSGSQLGLHLPPGLWHFSVICFDNESVFIYFTGYSLLFHFRTSENNIRNFSFIVFLPSSHLFSLLSFWNSFYSDIGPPGRALWFSFVSYFWFLSFCSAFWEIFSTSASSPSIEYFISAIIFSISRSSFLCSFFIL